MQAGFFEIDKKTLDIPPLRSVRRAKFPIHRIIIKIFHHSRFFIIRVFRNSASFIKTFRFYGEYEWNDEGDAIHWTHKEPDTKQVDGWLEYEGNHNDNHQFYQKKQSDVIDKITRHFEFLVESIL